jgi:ATP-dependent 26S proteasome regulatory subunit
VGVLAANNGHREFAVRCLNAAVEEDLPVSSLLSVLNQSQEGSGAVNPTFDIGNIGSIETAQALPTAEAQVTFKDVGGLESVKQIINRMIILPFQRPELYAKYGRISGWGRDALRPSWMRQNTAFKGNRR